MSDLRSLIETAKADGPSAAAKAKVWAGVSSAVGGAASMSGGGTATGSVGAMKMLVLGTLLGGSLTVGIGATMLVLRGAHPTETASGIAAPAPASAPPVDLVSAPVSVNTPASPRDALLGTNSDTLVEANVETNVESLPAAEPAAAEPRAAAVSGRGSPELVRRPNAFHTASAAPVIATRPLASDEKAQDDALAREASVLASARNALVRRDALTALQIVRGLASLPERQLVPEEMAVEAQALRGLGLGAQADAVDAKLRARFPDSVLGR
jgi:hypothetical protein